MAINNYIRPMLEVYQQLEVTVQLTQDRMAACIVGADYDLYRYGYEDLKPIKPEGLLTDGTQVIPLAYEPDPTYEYILDQSSLKLYAEGLLAPFGVNENTTDYAKTGYHVDASDPFVLRAPAGKLFAWTDAAVPEGKTAALGGTFEVAIGDTVGIWKGDDTAMVSLYRSGIVTDLVGAVIPADAATPTVTNAEHITSASVSKMETLQVATDTTFQVVVLAADSTKATCQITDSAGLSTTETQEVTLGTSPTTIVLGDTGVSLKATFGTGTEKGDAVYVVVTAPSVSTTEFDGIRLSNTPVELSKWNTYKQGAEGTQSLALRCFKAFTGWLTDVSVSDVAVDATTGAATKVTWTGQPKLRINGTEFTFASGFGSLYQQFRVMLSPAETEDVFTITSVADIQKYFGTVAVENDLAYGCAAALQGSAGRAVYALRVRNNTPAAYTAALNKVETNASTYSFAVLSEDMDVLEATAEYVEKRSSPEAKKWCRALCGIDSPGEYTLASLDGKGNPIKAAIVKPSTGNYYMLELAEGIELDFRAIMLNGAVVSVNPGDKVELASTGARYTIERVSSAGILLLSDGPVDNIESAYIRIIKSDSPTNAGEYVASVAERLNNRRFTVVFCDKGTVSDVDANGNYRTVTVPNKFLAASVAGIASAVVPQAPITRTEVPAVTAAVRMYTLYTQLELDNIAKHGVLIVTQDTKNQPCYIRHQLTTETDKGSLYYEESCTRNLDNISYAVVDILEQYIGKSNVTPSALRSIMTSVTNTLASFTQDSPNDLIGPSLVNWTDLTVEQDPVFKDRVIVRVKLYLPLPLNNIKMYEMAYAADVTV